MKEQIEKQAIEEMAKAIDNSRWRLEQDFRGCHINSDEMAENLYNEGYRKQSEGEWVETDYKTVEHGFVERRGKAWLCTNCRHASKEFHQNMKFCPNCGAKMKGGAE